MKIELEFTDPKDGLPEEDGYFLIYAKALTGKIYSEEVGYFDGEFTDYLGTLIPTQFISLWAKIPNYDELIKNKD